MTRFFSAILNFVLIGSAFAQGATPEEPIAQSNGYATIIFIVLFVGFCVGIVWMIMRGSKAEEGKEKAKEGDSKAGPPA